MLVLGFKLRTGLSQGNRWECWFLSVEQGQALCTSHFAVAIVRTTPSFLLEMIPKRSGDPSWLGLSEGWDRRFWFFCWKKVNQKKTYFTPNHCHDGTFQAIASYETGGGGTWDVVTQRQLIRTKEGVSTAITQQELGLLSVTWVSSGQPHTLEYRSKGDVMNLNVMGLALSFVLIRTLASGFSPKYINISETPQGGFHLFICLFTNKFSWKTKE